MSMYHMFNFGKIGKDCENIKKSYGEEIYNDKWVIEQLKNPTSTLLYYNNVNVNVGLLL